MKYKIPTDPFVNSIDECRVIAVDDKDYYKGREPGIVHPADDPGLKR